jgi:hypothetical protein
MEIVSTYSWRPCLSLAFWLEVEFIIFTFKRPIRAEVVTYLLDLAFGSLHMQQIHGFDEFRNDQGIIRNCTAQINITTVPLYLSESYFSFHYIWVKLSY